MSGILFFIFASYHRLNLNPLVWRWGRCEKKKERKNKTKQNKTKKTSQRRKEGRLEKLNARAPAGPGNRTRDDFSRSVVESQ